jgi:hypothetical protein
MFGFIIILVLVAIAAFAAYKSKTADGWDFKAGATALAAAGGAIWAWLSGLTDKF